VKPADQIAAPFYIRFLVKDRPGIVGDICQTFGKMAINISEIWQLSHGESELRELAKSHRLSEKPGRMLPFVITLERATAGQIRTALDIIGRKDYLLVEPVWFPIWRN
ncbi:MAG: ACT domain-containing protein, partial [Deltaproteobacteria bacterium]|nr:ACT domain-containing protein [Deltaproteobacteria bacterium]